MLARLLLLRGIAYFDKRDYESAIQDFDRSISLDPRLEKTWWFRGRARVAKRDAEHAIQDYSQAIVLAPDDVEALYDRGNAYLKISGPITSHTDTEGNRHIRLGSPDYPKAIQDFSRILQLQPNSENALWARAEAYQSADDYDHAIGDWGQIIALKPDERMAYYYRGDTCQLKGDDECVIRDFSKALELDPNGSMEQYELSGRGMSYLKTRYYDNAIKDFDRVLSTWPDDTRALGGRGEAYFRKGDLDRAIQDCTRAINLYAEDTPAYAVRGDAYMAKGDSAHGMQDLNQAIALRPTYHEFNDRAAAYWRLGDFDRAIQDYDRAAHANPQDAEALRGRGMMYARKGEYSLAIADLDQAIRLKPNERISYFLHGVVRFSMGDLASAQTDLARASTYNYASLWLYIARARSGEEARSGLSKDAVTMDLNSWPGPVIKYYLGNATQQSVVSAVRDPDPVKEREKLCEAYFYLGEQALIAGQRDKAAQFFRKTLDSGIVSFYEYAGAQMELEALQAKK